MCHNARRMAALRKFNAIIPLVIVGVLIHRAGRSKEQKSGEDQAAQKVQSWDKQYSLNFKGTASQMVCPEKLTNCFKFVLFLAILIFLNYSLVLFESRFIYYAFFVKSRFSSSQCRSWERYGIQSWFSLCSKIIFWFMKSNVYFLKHWPQHFRGCHSVQFVQSRRQVISLLQALLTKSAEFNVTMQ